MPQGWPGPWSERKGVPAPISAGLKPEMNQYLTELPKEKDGSYQLEFGSTVNIVEDIQ